MLPSDLLPSSAPIAITCEATSAASQEILPLAVLERRAIEHALTLHPHSAAEAARRLGISQATIYRKIKEYAINLPVTQAAAPQ
jgi:two-component system nitrogen regulation response regulator GlnG